MLVVDTNVLSELMRPTRPDRVVAWIEAQRYDEIVTTAITQTEILEGVARLPDRKRQTSLQAAANALFDQDFEDRILVFESRAAAAYADIVATRRRTGHPIDRFAAIVAANGARLATRNIADFIGCGFDVIDPWT